MRSGLTVHSVSALLFSLVQTTAHGATERISRRLRQSHVKKRRADEDEEDDDAESDDEVAASLRTLGKDTILLACSTELKPAVESAGQVSNSIVSFLLERGKSAKAGSTEADYKAVFDTLVTDLVAVFDSPEWPGAALLLRSAINRMVRRALLDDH